METFIFHVVVFFIGCLIGYLSREGGDAAD